MPITLGQNNFALLAQSKLSKSSDEISRSYERLSSGQRINHASDDAAGLAVSVSLNAKSRVLTQGVRNLNDGASLLNVADGALSQLSSITSRLQELATQSANGVYSNTQRSALNKEGQALRDEYNRIIDSTAYNGRTLLNGDYGALDLQGGFGEAGCLSLDLVSELGIPAGTGEYESRQVRMALS